MVDFEKARISFVPLPEEIVEEEIEEEVEEDIPEEEDTIREEEEEEISARQSISTESEPVAMESDSEGVMVEQPSTLKKRSKRSKTVNEFRNSVIGVFVSKINILA